MNTHFVLKFEEPSRKYVAFDDCTKTEICMIDKGDLTNMPVCREELQDYVMALEAFTTQPRYKGILSVVNGKGKNVDFSIYNRDENAPNFVEYAEEDLTLTLDFMESSVCQIMLHKMYSSRNQFIRKCFEAKPVNVTVNFSVEELALKAQALF